MGKKLDKLREKNFENMKVGFLLELGYRQDNIHREFETFIAFIEENKNFFRNIDVCSLTAGIESYNDAFYNFTDLIFKDVDCHEVHCKYHKKFY